jgi:hypothetical protein
MIARKRGAIVNIASIAAHVPYARIESRSGGPPRDLAYEMDGSVFA